MRPTRPLLVAAMIVASCLAVPAPAGAAAFTHPGVLVSRAQLDFVRANLGRQPWKSAWASLQASSYASLSYTPHPRSEVNCGPSSTPDNGCSDERKDANAAYTLALRWYLSKDPRYAVKAIQIMDAWSAVITKHTGANAPLQTGWAGANFSRAAELVKHTYPGWSQAARFAGKLRTVYLPTVIKGAPNNNGNWELIMTDAAIGIAVHLDDRASFDRAVRTWNGRLPAYIYLTTDGSLPKAPPGSTYDTKAEIVDYWHDQTTFVDGLTQETCRDFWYAGWGIAAISHVAETAAIQGLDLYAKAKHRLRRAMDLHAKVELTRMVPSWLCGGDVELDRLDAHLEVGFNALSTRLGYGDFPYAEQFVERERPAGVSHFLGWETLTHAENPEVAGVGAAAEPDFDGDGAGDLFSTSTGTLTIWNGNGSNGFGAPVAAGGGWEAYTRPVAGDFDGDGVADLLAAKKDGSYLYVWKGLGGNAFAGPERLGPGWEPYAETLTSLGDVDDDGRPDIGAVHRESGVLQVWHGQGGNQFGRATPATLTAWLGQGLTGHHRPVAGDFDGDGIGDLILVRKDDPSRLSMRRGTGNDAYGPGVSSGHGWEPYAQSLVSAGDVNGDGRDDLVAVHAETGTLHVWNGTGGLGFGTAVPVSPGWKAAW
ncbi:FG-GAP-like repeat-containing protein [Nonomuraea soli]|uniref:Alginate lyase domain-containing protein n=1 Tax=Nonomuraea soli TaxID=1032476 RepID=A0A7W0CT00_9ACTN|nr:FG-GAP-like repeat-containing protein [Nonomuraea soli]MBA2896615.1 hypothetical protein [Nonomuraea soli]